VAVRTYSITFDTAELARIFCKRLHWEFRADVASYRDEARVLVYDATAEGVADRVERLAKITSTELRGVR
jgi:hypothetical protein